MTYDNALNLIIQKQSLGIKPGLSRICELLNKMGNPQEKLNIIHIAGTNGKGSCTEIISNILINQGYKVGKFLSPHLIRYNERISINGEEISDEEMLNLIEELKPLIDKYNEKEEGNITLFELETTMALLYFYRKNVDFVVLETGLGGLYDCTNIITKPLVSIITSIGYDHMNILGNTLPEISYQKAGIIKENSNTVIFEQQSEVNNVFVTMCKSKNNNLHIVKKSDISNYSFDSEFQYFDYKEIKNLKINLKGKMQIQNASICIETMTILKQLGYNITEESIEKGLKNIVHKGRMEQLNDKPIIVYDGAHNEPAIQNLQNMIQMYYTNFNRVYIIAILKRKDYNKMLKLLAEDKNALYVLTSGNATDGYATSDELYECMKKYVPIYNICKKSLADAIEDAMSSEPNIANFIIGSFYMYGTVVNKIEEVKNKKLEKLRVF